MQRNVSILYRPIENETFLESSGNVKNYELGLFQFNRIIDFPLEKKIQAYKLNLKSQSIKAVRNPIKRTTFVILLIQKSKQVLEQSYLSCNSLWLLKLSCSYSHPLYPKNLICYEN